MTWRHHGSYLFGTRETLYYEDIFFWLLDVEGSKIIKKLLFHKIDVLQNPLWNHFFFMQTTTFKSRGMSCNSRTAGSRFRDGQKKAIKSGILTLIFHINDCFISNSIINILDCTRFKKRQWNYFWWHVC